jgi:hypothetical protein
MLIGSRWLSRWQARELEANIREFTEFCRKWKKEHQGR